MIHRALDVGINFFDTADIYGNYRSEECVGQSLGERRKDVILATKFGHPAGVTLPARPGGRAQVMRSAEASLKRLETDWIDLYQVHFPDPHTPIEETLMALADLVQQGKVRHVGCSNFEAWQMTDALWNSRVNQLPAFVSCQSQYNLLSRGIEREIVPAACHFGIGLLPFFPLASGLLTGKYAPTGPNASGVRSRVVRDFAGRFLSNDAQWAKIEILRAFCQARSRQLVELAIAWLLAQPVVSSVIAGATLPKQITQNMRGCDWVLNADELKEIDCALQLSQ